MKKKNNKKAAKAVPIMRETVNDTERNVFRNRLLMCFLPLALMILARLADITDEADIKVFMRLFLFGITAYGAYLGYKGRLTAGRVVTLLILAGVVVRWGYTMYTHVFTRSHDIGLNAETGTGHWGYLYHVMNGNLPPSNEYQFYQPPLFYMLSAFFIKAAMGFTGQSDWPQLLYMAQMVSCTASCVALAMTAGIMDKLKIKSGITAVVIAITAFYPAQILCGGRMNNDALVLMFMVLALYFTLCWHNDMKLKYIIGIALSIGFGMMTKINCGIVAFITGPVMVYHLVKTIRGKDTNAIKGIIIQLAVFAVICFPLGLWYPIRNYILFDQPLNYVHILGTNSFVYTGDASWAERWLIIPFSQFKEMPFMQVSEDTSIFMSLIKTGVHGEFEWSELAPVLAWGLDFVHTAYIALTGFAIVFISVKDKSLTPVQKYAPLAVWAVTAVSYVQFNISYPYICTADFRYVLLGQIASAFFTAYLINYCIQRKESVSYRCLGGFAIALTGLFCVMNIMHLC